MVKNCRHGCVMPLIIKINWIICSSKNMLEFIYFNLFKNNLNLKNKSGIIRCKWFVTANIFTHYINNLIWISSYHPNSKYFFRPSIKIFLCHLNPWILDQLIESVGLIVDVTQVNSKWEMNKHLISYLYINYNSSAH